jgi:hypothetical protein
MNEFFTTQSDTCHANLSETTDKIQKCLTDDEKTNTKTIATLFKLKDDIQLIKNSITNSLVTGDATVGTATGATISKEIQTRHNDLTAKLSKLQKEIKDKQSMIDKINRDFLDSNKNVNQTKVLFLEDYTMFFVLISYLFMIFIFIFVYTYAADNKLYAFGQAFIGSVIFTIAGGLILYTII